MRNALLSGLLALLLAAAPADAVTGGRPAEGEHPTFVQIDDPDGVDCGGTLVRDRWVLTAAHCIDQHRPDQMSVLVGSKRRAEGERFRAVGLTFHPRFHTDSVSLINAAYDVGVMELERPVPDVEPMRIADPSLVAPGTPATVVGLGANRYVVGDYRDELWQADFPIAADTDCRMYPLFDPGQHLCAGTFENESNACQGDSGGPLTVEDARGERVLAGTVSFGIGCGMPGTYNVYADVGSDLLRPWIEAQLPPEDASP